MVGFDEDSGQYQIEIKGLVEPTSKEAARICQEDINEVVTAFVQDKRVVERGLFDEELVPEEITVVRMGKIIKDRYPELEDNDVEAIRQRAVAAMNITQQAKASSNADSDIDEPKANTALIDGVRKFALSVRDLDIDLIDSINPFEQAYSILSKSMDEERLKQVASVISSKRNPVTPEEAITWAKRAQRFKQDTGRSPSATAQDPYERLIAEGATAFMRFRKEGRYE